MQPSPPPPPPPPLLQASALGNATTLMPHPLASVVLFKKLSWVLMMKKIGWLDNQYCYLANLHQIAVFDGGPESTFQKKRRASRAGRA
jgi:hypothetical protein